MIQPGEKHTRITGRLEGTHIVIRSCQRCQTVRADLESYGFCLLVGDLWEQVADAEENAEMEVA